MPKTTASKGATIQVRVGANMKSQIEGYAKAREQSVGEFVRYCIWTYMDQTEMQEAEDRFDAEEWERRDPEQSSNRPIEIGEIQRG